MSLTQGPLARSEDLIVEELGDELLIYDSKANYGHSLSPDAARVWRRCDGKTPREGLSAQLDLNAKTVERALDELDRCELLEERPVAAQGTTRRELTVKMVTVAGAAAAAPLILSVAAPTPAQAATLNFCLQFSSQNCGAGGGSAGCKSENGCCCCTPACGPGAAGKCPNCPPSGNGSKWCVPVGDLQACVGQCQGNGTVADFTC